MTRRLLILFVALAMTAGGLSLACDAGSNDAGPTEAPPPSETSGVPRMGTPPGTTVSAGGRAAEMGVGSYCWTAMCVDKIGPITKGSLPVSHGDRVVVAIPGGAPSLTNVNVIAFPAGRSSDLGNGETAWEPLFDRGSELPSTRRAAAIEFSAGMAPGSYVLVAAMFFEGGDVQYGVVLEVR